MKVDVEVGFRGGWLTQYFPDAKAEVEGAKPGELLPPLSNTTLGKLSWPGLVINGAGGKMPETTEGVWTAPRGAKSAPVTMGNERETFLFYRGVGHLEAPVHVIRRGTNVEMQPAADQHIGPMWLVDVRPGSRPCLSTASRPTGARLHSDGCRL